MRKPMDDFTKSQLKNVGKRLQNLRKKQYSNYEQFAFTHEIHRVQYGRYEQGSDMKLSSLIRVLQGLGISLQEFFAEGFDEIEPKKKED